MDRLSGDFNKGYTHAIMDVCKIFNNVQSDLTHHHKSMTYNVAMKLLACILKNRERIRESKSGFIRYNGQKDDFEFYDRSVNDG